MSRTLNLLNALAISTVVTAAALQANAAPPDYVGDKVVRLIPQDFRQLRLALALADDVWSHGANVGQDLDLMVDAESLAAMKRAGLPIEVIINDLGALIAEEKARLTAGAAEGGVAGGDAWFADFKTYAQINAKLDEFVVQRPDLCSVITIGTSLENRAIKALRISNALPGAPAILFNGCQHAREWISPMTVMYIANEIVDNASTDAAITALLDTAEIWFIPIVNPDGYQYSWDVNRLWRKNRRNNGDGTFGVDLNRNWSFQWGGGGASTNPGDETYRGPFPFSEPESAAMRDFYVARPNIVANIDFHSYSQLVLSPWGYTVDPAPKTAFMEGVGAAMADAIFGVHQTTYVSGPIASTLYVASGSSVDFAYGDQGVFSWTTELRDTGEFGFILPADQIIPTGEENFAGIMVLAAETLKPIAISFPNGTPSLVAPGGTTVAIETIDIAGEALPGGATLWWRDEAGEPFSGSPITEVTPDQWSATLPAPVCGRTLSWYVEFQTSMGVVRSPADAPASAFSTDVFETDAAFADDFETDSGWTVGAPGDNATAGIWARVDPNGTPAQPEDDSTPTGTLCFVTGQGPSGGAAGAADVDGGSTTLVSPVLDCSDPESTVQYDRWYSNNQGASPNSDSMPIEISSNGGSSWVQLELVTENAGAWVTKSFRVADYVTPSANVRVRFVARDLGSGSLVEAGVDGFRVFTLGCPSPSGDLNGDGDIDAEDLAILLGNWGGAGLGDLDGNGTIDAADLALLLGSWSA
jgi:murein tripeptide amidase MpaA